MPGLNDLIIEYKGMEDLEYNKKFERKLMILAVAGVQVMVLRKEDLEKIREIIVKIFLFFLFFHLISLVGHINKIFYNLNQ